MMTTADPSLRFWIRHVESAGGLHEPLGDTSLVVLPRELQVTLDLPEEVTVTADPEVAREDGAMLVAPGHPALDRAATAVLDAGDVGRVSLAWPASSPPDVDALIGRARDQFPVEHGRIDAVGEPTPVYHPVVRIGALVSYTVSLDHRFQERAECWVDACSLLEIPETVRGRLDRCAQGPPAARPTTAHEVVKAAASAHHVIDAATAGREQALAREVASVREAELSRTEAYYQEVLAGIARRRRTAPPDRLKLLEARAEATEAERVRRVAEIIEKHRPRRDIRPFRLHLVLVPALSLPVDVRRGDRRYPTVLNWLLPAAAFAPLPCPSCRREAPLVAGKDRLGCRDCMVRAASAPPASASPRSASPPSASPPSPPRSSRPQPARHSGSSRPTPPTRPTLPSATPRPTGRQNGAAAAPTTTTTAAAAAAPTRRSTTASTGRATPANRVRILGDQLGFAFWHAVAAGDRRLREIIAPDSPADAVGRLFGLTGLAVAIGMGRAERLDSVTSGADEASTDGLEVTSGHLQTDQMVYPYALRWRPVDTTAVVEEILPYSRRPSARQPNSGCWSNPGARAAVSPPDPLVDLDPVAARLWTIELPEVGFPVIARCLAAWWRVADLVDGSTYPPSVLAAAVTRLVGWRAGLRLSTDVIAARHRVPAETVKPAEKALQTHLQLSATRPW